MSSSEILSETSRSQLLQSGARKAGNRLPFDGPVVRYRLEMPADLDAIEALTDEAFGPGRYVRAAARIRELCPLQAELCFVATIDEAIVGSVRLSRLDGTKERSLMLGPLAVRPHLKGKGIGKTLMRRAAEEAKIAGFQAIYLVGDSPYYALLGYRTAKPGRFVLPWPVDPSRFLVLDL